MLFARAGSCSRRRLQALSSSPLANKFHPLHCSSKLSITSNRGISTAIVFNKATETTKPTAFFTSVAKPTTPRLSITNSTTSLPFSRRISTTTTLNSKMATKEYKLKGVTGSELRPGFMKQCEVEGIENGKVLLVQYGKNVRATSAMCSHYNLPLIKGILTEDGRVLCPLVSTGEIEDGPALDSLHSFPVKIDDSGDVIIEAEESKIKAGRRIPDMVEAAQIMDETDANILIVGGGSGCVGAIEGLRQHGNKDPVTVLSKESYAPIDRPKLSKSLMSDIKKLALRDEDFYKKFGVALHTSTVVSGVDFDKRSVTTEGGKTFTYKKLILATGGTPRKLPLEGFKTLGNIFVLRTIDDTKAIMQAAGEDGGKKVVVVGSSFIGMEVGNCLAGKKHDVTIIGMEEAPMQRVVGKKIGEAFQKLLENKSKVKFEMSATVDRADPSESGGDKVGSVTLKDGKKLEADLVILGVGVGPETSYLEKSLLQKDGSLVVDENFQVKDIPDVYAVGDIATYPYKGQMVRIEHWNVAQNSGRAAGQHIATGKKADPFTPVFWSALGFQLRYCGYGGDYDDIVFSGEDFSDESSPKFMAYFTKGDNVTAVATMQKDPSMVQASELMRSGAMPSKKELQEGLDIMKLSVPAYQS